MKTVILLDGNPPSVDLCQSETKGADLIIATDGAYDYAVSYGIIPQMVIGDMDSVEDKSRVEKDVEETRIYQEEKDEPDSQLAIDLAIERGTTDIVLLGMTGGRIDHEYGNLMLMLRTAKRGVNIIAIDKYNHMTVRTGDIEISGRVGQKVSLLPIGSEAFIESTEGLYYQIDNKVMNADIPIGISNVFIETTARLKVIKGYLLVVKVLDELD